MNEGGKPRILVVDDDRLLSDDIGDLLTAEGYDVLKAHSAAEAVEVFPEFAPDLVLLDLMLPDAYGLDLLKRLCANRKTVATIVLSGADPLENTLRAMQQHGVYDYFVKPFNTDDLLQKIQTCLSRNKSATNLLYPGDDVPKERALIGRSRAMQEVYKTIGRVAASNQTVMVVGETGSGKTLVAEAIHRASRRPGDLVHVDCAALSETLLESELFGHEKGAFTGAISTHRGKFEMASDGTVFLDEVGELSPAAQKKLLRVLQEHTFERVGSSRPIMTNARVISATHRDLRHEVSAGRFRQDLFFRLSVVVLPLPPLREHKEDIEQLTMHFLAKHSRPGSPPRGITQEAIEVLKAYDWPGNVRELENCLARAIVMSSNHVIDCDDLHFDYTYNKPTVQHILRLGGSLQDIMAEVEGRALREALHLSNGDMACAAERLRLTVEDFQRRWSSHGFE